MASASRALGDEAGDIDRAYPLAHLPHLVQVLLLLLVQLAGQQGRMTPDVAELDGRHPAVLRVSFDSPRLSDTEVVWLYLINLISTHTHHHTLTHPHPHTHTLTHRHSHTVCAV